MNLEGLVCDVTWPKFVRHNVGPSTTFDLPESTLSVTQGLYNTETTVCRNPRAPGCSDPSAARALLGARGFLHCAELLSSYGKFQKFH